MKKDIKIEEIFEELEEDIIFYNCKLVREPKLKNNLFGCFINVGRIDMLRRLGYLEDDFRYNQFMKLAKGYYKQEIFEDFNKAQPDDILSLDKYFKKADEK